METLEKRPARMIWSAAKVAGKTLPVKENGESLSTQEYFELKREVKRLNKPGVTVIKTKYGEIYDCVEIYKQPAFDNPRLKNHTIQLQPSFISEVAKKEGSGSLSTVDIRLPDGAKCPQGTVPLQRMTMEHLIRAKSLAGKGKRIVEIGHRNFSRKVPSGGGVFSVAQKIGGEYYGLSARFNVWAPNLTQYEQISASQMWLIAGKEGYGFDTVEAGWMVDPINYPDVSAYLFTYSTNDGYQTGCLDRQCRFIHVNNEIPLPMLLRDVSVHNGKQESIVLSLYKMGSGRWAEYGYTEAAFISDVHLLDKIANGIGLPDGVQTYNDNIYCYSTVDNLKTYDPVLGRHIYFGGPGEEDCM
ncbi:protein neprosin-like [Aristolochia californica]|uniref:protein neprosin-like n=1 Tax=Aristolochia californica TaxID=171875 RepID=UPI0035DF3BD0